jgi:spore coat protein A
MSGPSSTTPAAHRVSRRTIVRTGGAGVGLWFLGTVGGVPVAIQAAADPIAGGTLPPGDVGKFVTDLIRPPAMPPSRSPGRKKDLYRIAVRQFEQQILPASAAGATTVWSYGSVDHPDTFNYPAYTIEAPWGRKVTVEWRNELVAADGSYLPHLLPIDPTLHWANPPGGQNGRDTRPTFATTPGAYTGPVPMVTHVHGAHTTEDSDGYPEAWYLPAATNLPKGWATTGTFYDYFNRAYKRKWAPGTASFSYPNDQRATTLWYHDHTLGMTRANVYAGPAGFYLIRGGPDDVVLDSRDSSAAILPGPAPTVGDSPFGEYGEIPIVIQDRSFDTDGQLFYPDTREFFDDYVGPYLPETPVSPIWNPEFFGTMMVVNGRTWPYLEVEAKRYRLRLLNGCDSRFLILQFEHPGVEVWQIGSDGGFLPAPVRLNAHPYPGSTGGGATVLLAPAERADVIVDFSAAAGTSFRMLNLGPDSPFGGGAIGVDFDASDEDSTGQVMEFRVAAGSANDPTTPPQYLALPGIPGLGTVSNVRDLSLNEEAWEDGQGFEGPVAAVLGTYDTGTEESTPLLWMAPVTEDPAVGATEEWRIHNLTEDAHPIHLHQVQFQVVSRTPVDPPEEPAGPEPWETGFKDTVIAYPEQVTTVRARFDLPGLYVWHCHILEHEDNEMMRPYHVGPIPPGSPLA